MQEKIDYYNHHRIHSGVIDIHGKEHPPEYRFRWKKSKSLQLDYDLDIDSVFNLYCIPFSSQTRKVNAQRQIRYREKAYTGN